MVDKFIIIPTGAKSASELKFKQLERRGKQPKFDYNAVITALSAKDAKGNYTNAYVLDKDIKEQTARSAIKKLKEKMPKGITVKVRKIDGTERDITVGDKKVTVYQLAFVPMKEA